jgi:ribonuclease T
VQAAGLTWDESSAHSAAYDAEITADLFCKILNRFKPIFDSTQPQEWSDQPDESAADSQ